MIGFRRDDEGDWVAELSCLALASTSGTIPRSREAAWIEDDEERAGRVGQPLDCPLCDRAELPEGLRPARTTATWDASTVPAALRRATGWPPARGASSRSRPARSASRRTTDPPIDVLVTAERAQPIPPELDHHVDPVEGARFHVTFLAPRVSAGRRGWRGRVLRPPPRRRRAVLTGGLSSAGSKGVCRPRAARPGVWGRRFVSSDLPTGSRSVRNVSESDHVASARAVYDASADRYIGFVGTEVSPATEGPVDRALLNAFVEMIHSGPGTAVADVGCGPGRVAAFLAAHQRAASDAAFA